MNGSVEAVLDALETYKSQQIKLSVLHSGVGPVSENDVKKAAPFKGKFDTSFLHMLDFFKSFQRFHP